MPQLEKLPHRADVLGLLAAAYAQAGETERARRTYEAALGKEPRRADLEEGLAGLGSEAPRDPLEVVRRDVRRRIRKKSLTHSVPDLRRRRNNLPECKYGKIIPREPKEPPSPRRAALLVQGNATC